MLEQTCVLALLLVKMQPYAIIMIPLFIKFVKCIHQTCFNSRSTLFPVINILLACTSVIKGYYSYIIQVIVIAKIGSSQKYYRL